MMTASKVSIITDLETQMREQDGKIKGLRDLILQNKKRE